MKYLHELYCEHSIFSLQGDVGLQGDKGDKVRLTLFCPKCVFL